VANYFAQPEYEYLPLAQMMRGDKPDKKQCAIWRSMPLPLELVPLFLEGPIFEKAIQQLDLLHSGDDKCLALKIMIASAMCTQESNSNISMLTIASTKLVYSPPDRKFAERWWNKHGKADPIGTEADISVIEIEDEDMYKTRSETSDNNKINVNVNPCQSKVPANHTSWSHEDPPSSKGSDNSSSESSRDSSSNNSSNNSNSEGDEDWGSASSNSSDEEYHPPPSKKKSRKLTHVITPTTHTKKKTKAKWGQMGEMTPFFNAMVRMSNKHMKTALKANRTAVSTTEQLASKMSVTQREVLEACTGHHDSDEPFTPPPIYNELEVAGWQKDAVYAALRCRCVEVKGSRHRDNVHISSRMVVNFKSGNLSMGRDKTFEGCTVGVTLLAVPHISQKMANDNLLENQAFEDATHKTQADNKKHLAGQKFAPPKSLHELIRVLNNYICWIEVMFRSNCKHLIQVV
jgi:hypothetical protein